ncbi:PREDICTED: uncharacterized protein LOC109339246 [Lupinus angustifolius]|uniref:uncharacterized protein LOC109339246 n=1 Tax=Lupinus angustifolius TaxID=3871 RepID=UPI00092F1EC5|nr:PREDICTED: uncharacterized protein LOC109339246 [Lupinus angustifolius]
MTCPQGLGDFIPISLVVCIYKTISKILAGRLKRVIHSIISECQTTFLKDGNIMDGVVIANEVVDQASKKEKKSCLQSSSVSVLVNGSPTSEFPMAHGLRQGDHIAHFLFLIVAEGIGGIMRLAVSRNLFSGYLVGTEGVVVSHLQYADDTLLIGENTSDNILVLKCILKCFELISGLKTNFHKNKFIGVKAPSDFIQMAVNKLLCGVGSVPFKFLGIPVGANTKRCSTWTPIIESFKKKFSLWQQKLISFGGQLWIKMLLLVPWVFGETVLGVGIYNGE